MVHAYAMLESGVSITGVNHYRVPVLPQPSQALELYRIHQPNYVVLYLNLLVNRILNYFVKGFDMHFGWL